MSNAQSRSKRTGASVTSIPTGNPTTLETLPSTRSTRVDPSVWIAYPPPLPKPHVTLLLLLGEAPEDDGGLFQAGHLLPIPQDHEPAEHLVSPPRHPLQILPSLNLAFRLPQGLLVQDDIRIAGNHKRPRASLHGPGLHPRVLHHLHLRIPTRQLLHPGHHHLELDPQLPKNLFSLRRAGREDHPQLPSGAISGARAQDSSGNQIPISRAADSSESDP